MITAFLPLFAGLTMPPLLVLAPLNRGEIRTVPGWIARGLT